MQFQPNRPGTNQHIGQRVRGTCLLFSTHNNLVLLFFPRHQVCHRSITHIDGKQHVCCLCCNLDQQAMPIRPLCIVEQVTTLLHLRPAHENPTMTKISNVKSAEKKLWKGKLQMLNTYWQESCALVRQSATAYFFCICGHVPASSACAPWQIRRHRWSGWLVTWNCRLVKQIKYQARGSCCNTHQ